MRTQFFNWLGRVTYQKYWLVLIIALLVTIALGAATAGIKMEATWMSLLHPDSPSVKSFAGIIDEFGAATNIVLALKGPSKERITAVAEEIVVGLDDIIIEYEDENGNLVRQRAFKRVDYKYDLDFVGTHGLLLEKAKNLKKQQIIFTDYNLVPFFTHVNDVYESQWIADADNLTKQEKDAARGLDGMFTFFHSLAAFAYSTSGDSGMVQAGVDAMTIGDGYYLSSDKKMLLIFISPTISVNEIEPSVIAVDSLEARLSQFKIQYPDVHFGITGMQVVMRDEMDAGISDTMRNLAVAAVLILAIFVLSFRMWSGPLLALLVLLTGITWDIGLAQIVIGRLNIITVMCSIVLVGLGIDYAIHILSAYSEFRHKGETIEGAIAQAFQKIGSGLLTGALTTAVAFLSLTTIGSPAFKEFGFVTGAGIITCLLASIFLLPAAIVAKEKLWRLMTRREHLKRVDMEFRFLGRITRIATARPWVTVGIVLLITIALALQIPRVSMNRNYMDLEPEGLESIRLQRELVKRFHMSPDNMMAIYDSVEEVNQVQDRLYSQPAVGMVESIASVLPSEKKQRARLPYVRDIHEAQADLLAEVAIDTKALVEQLHRFSDNIIEISSMAYTSGLDRVFDKANQFVGLNEDGNQVGSNHAEELAGYLRDHPEAVVRLGDYQAFFRNIMKQRITEMSDTTMITLAMVPESFREHYVSADGSHFLMAFYSKNDVWDGLFTSPFLKTILRNAPQATGSPIFMREMVETTKREGIIAFAIALLAILLLLLVDFRSLLTAITALLPLLLAVIWLFGLMGALGIKVTIINVIGFPLLIGIGIDDGVHVIHRYRVEGKARLSYAMSSIGKAILLTSITTMLGFGSLVSSDFRGYIGLGLVVTIGIGLCFITSVIVLPAILKLLWGSRSWQPQLFIGAAVL